MIQAMHVLSEITCDEYITQKRIFGRNREAAYSVHLSVQLVESTRQAIDPTKLTMKNIQQN